MGRSTEAAQADKRVNKTAKSKLFKQRRKGRVFTEGIPECMYTDRGQRRFPLATRLFEKFKRSFVLSQPNMDHGHRAEAE